MIRFHVVAAAVLLLAFLAGCEKPQLKTEGKQQEESGQEMLADDGSKPPTEELAPAKVPSPVAPPPKATPKAAGAPRPNPSKGGAMNRAQEIAMKETMLEAQQAGIRSLESDLSRHTNQLNQLRQQLQTARARQSSARGGLRVEMVDGKSTRVGDPGAVRQLQGQVANEEQFVEQLSKSLTKARQQYVALSAELQRLKRGQ